MTTFQEVNSITNNCASTFEFSQEDAERILMPSDFLGGSMSCDEFRVKLERLRQKETRKLMHGTTLSEYWRNKKIPRGLRMQKAPTIGMDDENFVKRWGEILNKCSLDLMLLIIEQCSTEAQQIKAEIQTQETLLKEMSGSDFSALEAAINESTNHYRQKLHAMKLKKYKKVTDDYLRNEVYEWEFKAPPAQPESSTTGIQQPGGGPRPHSSAPRSGTQRPVEESSLDSDYAYDSDSGLPPRPLPPPPRQPSFLDQRQEQHHRKKGAGGAKGHQRKDHWTRSYTKKR